MLHMERGWLQTGIWCATAEPSCIDAGVSYRTDGFMHEMHKLVRQRRHEMHPVQLTLPLVQAVSTPTSHHGDV